MTTHLLIIDPQQDFCDGPCNGALAVPGAYQDMLRLARFLDQTIDKIDQIHVSLDCHRLLDIAHPNWWIDHSGAAPDPFTVITAQEIEDGIWSTRHPEAALRSLHYVKALESQGNYPLCIWPPHCLEGTQGQSIHPELADILLKWENHHQKSVNMITKGNNPWTEHYSAIQAEVHDPNDVKTQPNLDLILALQDASQILISGEALSHCVKSTVEDLGKLMGPKAVQKFHFLINTSSSVPGFEELGKSFIDNLTAQGMKISRSNITPN